MATTRDRPDLVTVKQAAEELQLTVLTLRWLMAEGKLDLGLVVDRPGSKSRRFIIYRAKLDAEKARLGIR